jgi:signal transduction histidine kinase
MLTAKGTVADIDRGTRTGAEYYILKPFDINEMKNLIESILEDINKNDDFRPALKKDIQAEYGFESLLTRVNGLLDSKIYELTVLQELFNFMVSSSDPLSVKIKFLKTISDLFSFEQIIYVEPSRKELKPFPKGIMDQAMNSDFMFLDSKKGEIIHQAGVLNFNYREIEFSEEASLFVLKVNKCHGKSKCFISLSELAKSICDKTGFTAQTCVTVVSKAGIKGFLFFTDPVTAVEKCWYSMSLELFVKQFGMGLDNLLLTQEIKSKIINLEIANRDLSRALKDLENTNAELTHTRERLITSEKLATVGKLAAGVAHEINNPLGIISACAESLIADLQEHKMPLNEANIILSETKRAAKFVKHLLSFSREMPAELTEIEIVSLINNTLDTLKLTGKYDKLDVAFTNLEKEVFILGSNEIFTTILRNLIDNAADAVNSVRSEKGCITIELKTKSQDIGNLNKKGKKIKTKVVELIVKDNGKGFNNFEITKLFDPFYTTKQVGQGYGLGLAIVHSAVKMFKGEIQVKSRPGESTVFSVIFPMVKIID